MIHVQLMWRTWMTQYDCRLYRTRPRLSRPARVTPHHQNRISSFASVLYPCSPGAPMSSRNLSLVLSAQNTLRLTLAYASPAAALSLRLLPRIAKIIAYLVLILNFRSLPFGWHSMLMFCIFATRFSFFSYPTAIIFWPVIKIRWHAWCARMRTLSLSSAVRDAAASKYLDTLSPVGQNPLNLTVVTKGWAGAYHRSFINRLLSSVPVNLCISLPLFLIGIDDCDYNRHLSNSSYPKVRDGSSRTLRWGRGQRVGVSSLILVLGSA